MTPAAGTAVVRRWVLPFAEGSREQIGLLGGKGANLAELGRLGVPIPPGFVITTEACRAYLEHDELPPELMTQVRAAMGELEAQLGRTFGDTDNPLLVSVRSGAPISMPGMMETILNVGLGPATVDAFAQAVGDPEVAADCLRRLTHMYTAAVEADLPDEPELQLEHSIAAVFRSWNTRRAKLYRRYHGSEDTGTAVVVQAMVFGNSGPRSGTGVLFTRDPSTGDREPYGDYLANAQGEDIVAGSHNADDLGHMKDLVPEAHAELLVTAERVERHFRDMCEIEFTVEDGRLWLLQSRAGQRSARASVRMAVQLVREGVIDPGEAIERVGVEELDALLHPHLDRERVAQATVVATGIAASPGLATGEVVLDGTRATELAARGHRLVLVRDETRPDDLEGILAATGLLTTRGGKTSHAAVVTRGLGRPCVCGAESIAIHLERRVLVMGDVEVAEGETISIDGDGGLVLRGAAPVVTPSPPEETAELLRWCDERRTLRVAGIATVADRVRLAVDYGADEIVLGIAAGVEDPASLVPAALAAADGRPLTVLSTAEADTDAGRAELPRLVEAVAQAGGSLLVPAGAWRLAADIASRCRPVPRVVASTSLEDVNAGVPLGGVNWEAHATKALLDVNLPTDVPLALPPDLEAASMVIVRRLGALVVIVPPDRVPVARLALAKEAG